jgi:hypothetical protein
MKSGDSIMPKAKKNEKKQSTKKASQAKAKKAPTQSKEKPKDPRTEKAAIKAINELVTGANKWLATYGDTAFWKKTENGEPSCALLGIKNMVRAVSIDIGADKTLSLGLTAAMAKAMYPELKGGAEQAKGGKGKGKKDEEE